jgi:hypothetical protein
MKTLNGRTKKHVDVPPLLGKHLNQSKLSKAEEEFKKKSHHQIL